MAETPSGPFTRTTLARRTALLRRTAGKGARTGLEIRRIYTREGVHPYDEVTWERRDVVMTNWRDGSVNFEQRGVEFPDFWSVNAANIVTTKYFRGAVGTPQREWSLKQLIDRVVGTYGEAGRKHGYFATESDAEIFEHELTYALVASDLQLQLPGLVQRRDRLAAAGLRVLHPGRRRHDGVDPELVPRRGADLQGRLRRRASTCPGSGPAKELLASGGTASGPVSLHARRRRLGRHDQVRRRHPARGEDGRARRRPPRRRGVHRDQGAARRTRSGSCATPGSTWTWAARTSSASSTRTPTTRSGSPTSSCGRSRRAASSTCAPARPARSSRRSTRKDLFRKMAKAAWECADPGIQYDDTINDWHTCPESGRITRQQPVLRVRPPGQLLVQPGQHQPAEVPARRRHLRRRAVRKAVEFIITAMDISICFADFPTEKIADTTRAYRQLGIGYANLGALLMATGHAYDSDGGRALAGGDHLADDRHGVQALGRARRGGRPVRRLRPQRRRRTSGSCASTPRPTTTIRPVGADDASPRAGATKAGQECLAIGETNG